MEAAGVVAAVGEGVTTPTIGTRVVSFVRGGYAEYALADAAQAVLLPDAWTSPRRRRCWCRA